MEAVFLVSLIITLASFLARNTATVGRLLITNAVMIVGIFIFVFALRGLGGALGSTAGVDRVLISIGVYALIALSPAGWRLSPKSED